MKQLLVLLILTVPFVSKGQSLTFYPGANYGQFRGANEQINEAVYSSEFGFSFRTTYEHHHARKNKGDTIPLRFEFYYDRYSGNFYQTWSQKLANGLVSGKAVRDVVGFSFYPINLTFVDKLRVSAGIDFGFLANQELEGIAHSSNVASNPLGISTPLIDESKTYCGGIAAQIAYRLDLGYRFFIEPMYSFYWGLSSEVPLPEPAANLSSFRHRLYIGFGFKFNK
jgi:hypothetical protein